MSLLKPLLLSNRQLTRGLQRFGLWGALTILLSLYRSAAYAILDGPESWKYYFL
jgi:hypothetical protein